MQQKALLFHNLQAFLRVFFKGKRITNNSNVRNVACRCPASTKFLFVVHAKNVFRTRALKEGICCRIKCIDPIESPSTCFQGVPETSVYICLTEPCAGCAVTFENEKNSLQHFSRSVCKKFSKDVIAERRHLKRREYDSSKANQLRTDKP